MTKEPHDIEERQDPTTPSDDKPLPPPSIWRLIRAHLKLCEMSTVNDIHQWITIHRPNYKKPHLYRKLTMLTERGLIKQAKWGSYSITQKGAEDAYHEDPKQLEEEDRIAPFVPGPNTIYRHAQNKTTEPQKQAPPKLEPPKPASETEPSTLGHATPAQLMAILTDHDTTLAMKNAATAQLSHMAKEISKQLNPPDNQQQIVFNINGHDIVLNLRIKVSMELA
jgi:hypothetical protein